MLFVRNKLKCPVVRLNLNGGLCGIAALSDSAGGVFSKDDWTASLAEIDKIESNPLKVLKREGSNSVIVNDLGVGSCRMKVVVKTHLDKSWHVNLTRYFRPGRSLRSFRTALMLKNAGISAEVPLAALWQKKSVLTAKSLYITEYIPHVANLHWFAKRDLPAVKSQFSVKRRLAGQLAAVLAALDANGLWHRDAKPGNFLVRKDRDGQYGLTLVDLDGVKSYHGLRTFNRRFRPFVNLAALRLISPLVYKTDCLRTFKIYCNLIGLDKAERKRLFRRLVKGPVARKLKILAMKRPEWARQ
jgi:hypothetical protein